VNACHTRAAGATTFLVTQMAYPLGLPFVFAQQKFTNCLAALLRSAFGIDQGKPIRKRSARVFARVLVVRLVLRLKFDLHFWKAPESW
jgi:hypothetical protein